MYENEQHYAPLPKFIPGEYYIVSSYYMAGVYKFLSESGDNFFFVDQSEKLIVIKQRDIYKATQYIRGD